MIIRRFACALNRWLGLTRPRVCSCGKQNEGRRDERDRFDTFTERARNVLTLAEAEAQRLSHPYLGTEHLLLGLVREGEGVAWHVLRSLGVELDQVRQAVEARIGRGDQVVRGEIGSTPRAKRVLELAVLEARHLDTITLEPNTSCWGCSGKARASAPGYYKVLGWAWSRCVRKRWRGFMKRSRQQRVCSFCGTPQNQIQRLIAGPNVYVCDACVSRLRTSPEAHQEQRGLRCSFCGKTQRQVAFLAVGPQGVSICNACLDLCQEILMHAPPHQC